MTTDSTTNFLGIPISGDINRPTPRVEQRPREEFEAIVRALLDDPFFVEFGWRQRTPYFNDGDPCMFSAFGTWVRTATDGGDDDYDEDDTEGLSISYSEHPTLGGYEGWADTRRYIGDHEAQRKLADALDDAIDGHAFDQVLLDLFGDHCEIKVSRDGIAVDDYNHN